jgi:general secretion pathway protein F
MPVFAYTALTATGKTQNGTEQGDSAADIRQFIRQQGWVPISVEEFKQQQKKTFSWRRGKQLNKAQLALITRQLATLLEAGMPLDEALSCVAEQQDKPHLNQIVMAIHSKISEGFSLADALSSFPRSFPVIYRTTIAAAEKSGKLDQVLVSLAEYTEKQQKIKRQIQQALVYPCVMALVSFSIVTFLLLNIVPTITQVFVDSQQTLPTATQMLLHITHFLQQDWWLLLLIIIAITVTIARLLRVRRYRYLLDRLLLRIPALGKTIANINSARFARSLGILQAATVPVLDALTAANALVRPLPMRDAVSRAIQHVREGKGIADSLAQCPHFPRMLVHLIHSGEQSGRLADMLHKAAATQEDDVEALIQSALSLFEPLMIVVMGGIVLFIVLAVMLPIFSLDQLAGQT